MVFRAYSLITRFCGVSALHCLCPKFGSPKLACEVLMVMFRILVYLHKNKLCPMEVQWKFPPTVEEARFAPLKKIAFNIPMGSSAVVPPYQPFYLPWFQLPVVGCGLQISNGKFHQ